MRSSSSSAGTSPATPERLQHGADHLLYHLLDLRRRYSPPSSTSTRRSTTPRTRSSAVRPRDPPDDLPDQASALRLHRVLAPEREVLNRLARDEYDPIHADHRVYFRDVYDHLVRIHDITESLRDLIAGALDTYLSAISNRTNDIMKTLTLVTVMFLPMSFLAGFFGMNFFGETLVLADRPCRGGCCSVALTCVMVVPILADVALGAAWGVVLSDDAEARRAHKGRDGDTIGARYNPIEDHDSTAPRGLERIRPRSPARAPACPGGMILADDGRR